MNTVSKILTVFLIVLAGICFTMLAVMNEDTKVLKVQEKIIESQTRTMDVMEKMYRQRKPVSAKLPQVLPGTKVLAYDKDGQEVLVQVKNVVN